MTTALEGGEGSASGPGRSLPPGKTRYPLYRRLGGLQGRSGQVRKISPHTGIRSPDRPARSQSLYRLSYPGHTKNHSYIFFTIVEQSLVGQGILTVEDSWSYSDRPHSVGLLWTSNQPDADTSTWQHSQQTSTLLAGFEPTISASE